MTDQQAHDSKKELDEIIQSAKALGVEMDEEEAIQWLTTIAAHDQDSADVSVDIKSGVFAHRVVLLDFDPSDLERVRRVASIVEIEDRPNVETAISLSGSSAQSHVQTFPGDFDYFERVNIKADTKEEACTILADVIRDKAMDAASGPGYQMIEVRFGSYQQQVIRGEKTMEPGGSIQWSPAEIEDGHFEVLLPGGESMTIDLAYAAQEPGWCKLDWVLVDPAQPRAVKASNMLDVTWEAPDGTITPLDGFIDPYYQEVYLDAESIPLFSKISKQIEPDALHTYVSQLEKEIVKYTSGDHPNYGKAAKRMYNVFRLTGRYEEAAYIRELFDEPAALLYQVNALLDGLIDLGSESTLDRAMLARQIDDLIRDITQVAEGPSETGLIMSLLRIRDDITGLRDLGEGWEITLLQMQQDIGEMVNTYFKEQLYGIPKVAEYLERIQ